MARATKRRGNPNWIKGGSSPNPTGRRRADSAPGEATIAALANAAGRHRDGWENAGTGLGVAGRDKAMGTVFIPDIVSPEDALQIYRGDPIGARCIDLPADAATREGVELCIGDFEAPEYYDPPEPKALPGTSVMPGKPLGKGKLDGASRRLNAWERRIITAVGRQRRDVADAKGLQESIEKHLIGKLGALGHINEALKQRAATGGSAILIGANDYTTDMRQPLELRRVRSLDYLCVLEARELTPLYWYNDPFDPNGKFGQVAVWQLVPFTVGAPINPGVPVRVTQIHESRLIHFRGPRVSRRQQTGQLNGHGDSVFTRVVRALRAFNTAHQNIETLLADFAQAVYKIKGLAEALTRNPNALTDAMLAVELGRSICRAVVISEEEEFERKSTSLQGYPDMLERLALNLCASSGIPLSMLVGKTASGLNASSSGANDTRMFFDNVSVIQTNEVGPAMLRLTEIEIAAAGEDPETVSHSIGFCPLWQPTELEIAQTRLAVAQTDHIYLQDQVVSPEEIALSRFGGDAWSMETHLDFEARAAQQAVLPPAVNANPQPDPMDVAIAAAHAKAGLAPSDDE